MKKLCVFLVALVVFAIFIGTAQPAEASPWRFVCVADSIDASAADTFFVETKAYSKGFYAIGYNWNGFTGATDGAWSFEGVFTDGKIGSAEQYFPLYVIAGNAVGVTATLAPGNVGVNYILGPHLYRDSMQLDETGSLIPGDKLRIIYTPNSVTGGYTSLYIRYQVVQ